MATLVDDLDLGGRISLDDQISKALDSVTSKWTAAGLAGELGGAAISYAADKASAALSKTGEVVRVFATFPNVLSAVAWGVGNVNAGFQALVSAGSRGLGAVSSGMGVVARSIAALGGQSGALGMLLGGPVGIATMLHRVMSSSIQAGAEIENLQLAFTTLMHGSDAARAHLAELQAFAVGKPFEFSQLAVASRTLQTYGFQAREVMGILGDIGDVASGAGTGARGFDTITRVFGQINAMGRITRGQMSELVNSGVEAPRILREQLHLTDRQIANIAKSGIPAARILEALRNGMRSQWGGGMARAALTLDAKLSDLNDVIGNLKREIYGALGPVMLPLISAFSDFLVSHAERIGTTVSTVISTVIRLVEALVMPVFGALSDEMGRASTNAHTHVGHVLATFQNAALLIEGFAALIVGDDGHGITSIPAALRDRLVRAGLWKTAVEIARFADRARAFVTGFVDQFATQFAKAEAVLKRVTDALGITGNSMGSTRESARTAGAETAKLLVSFLALRAVAPIVSAISAVFTVLPAIFAGVTAAMNFMAMAAFAFNVSMAAAYGIAILIIAVVAAVIALVYWLATSATAAAFFARTWKRVTDGWATFKAVLASAGAWLSALWARFKAFGASVRDAIVGVAARAFNTVRGAVVAVGAALGRAWDAVKAFGASVAAVLMPAWNVLKIIGAFFAVTLYLLVLGIVKLFLLVGGAVWSVLSAIGGAVGSFFAWLGGIIGGALVWIGARFIRGLQEIGAAIWSFLSWVGRAFTVALRAIGSVVGGALSWVGARFVRGLQEIGGWIVSGLAPIIGAFRLMGEFLAPYVTGIFTAIGATVSGIFHGITESILGALRFVARELVRVYNGLPAFLRPAALNGSIRTLMDFSVGPVPTPDNPNPAHSAVIAARTAPARAANAREAAAGARAANAPAPTVNVQPTPVTLVLDGAVLARSAAAHNDDEALRTGGTRSTTGRNR